MALMDLDELRKGQTFSEIVSFTNTSRNLQEGNDPERLSTLQATRGLFHLLGVSPLFGRTFQPDDPLKCGGAECRPLEAAVRRGPQIRSAARFRWMESRTRSSA